MRKTAARNGNKVSTSAASMDLTVPVAPINTESCWVKLKSAFSSCWQLSTCHYSSINRQPRHCDVSQWSTDNRTANVRHGTFNHWKQTKSRNWFTTKPASSEHANTQIQRERDRASVITVDGHDQCNSSVTSSSSYGLRLTDWLSRRQLAASECAVRWRASSSYHYWRPDSHSCWTHHRRRRRRRHLSMSRWSHVGTLTSSVWTYEHIYTHTDSQHHKTHSRHRQTERRTDRVKVCYL